MISRLGLRISEVFRRTAPDPLVLAVLLTLLTSVLCLTLGTFPGPDESRAHGVVERAMRLLDTWGSDAGLWAFLKFGMQMCVILITGHALAASRPVHDLITRLAAVPRSAAGAAAMTGLIAACAGLVNWGLGLIVGALLAREVGRSMRHRGIACHYPLIVAAGYMGLLVWHGGLSGSAPLSSTTAGQLAAVFPKDAATSLGPRIITPLSGTLFTPLNLVISGGLLVLIPVTLRMLSPRVESDMRPMGVEDAADAPIGADSPAPATTIPERLERSRILAIVLAVLLLGAFARFGFTTGLLRVSPNEVSLAMLAMGLLAHGSLASYGRAVEDAARGCAGIMLQFPLYAGIVGMLTASGLLAQFAGAIAESAPAGLLPLVTFVSAAIVNLFVPSGGGQWGVQGPIVMEAAVSAGVAPGRMIMAVAYGDQLTNMLQPFWALPLLAITGVKAREIIGYTAIVMLVAGAWIGVWLVVL